MLAIRSAGLTKRFGRQVAVDGIDLAVPAGAVYGFLGPNGSGKTTTIRMLLGLVRPTAGSHELLGEPLPAGAGQVLPAVGAMVEGPAFHPYLSGRANLARLDAADRWASPGRAAARRRIEQALERVGLAAAARKHYRAYSLGMRQRLALAAALLRPRELLLLDEPTNGLDPQGTREVRGLISELAAAGATVFLSTHLLSEVEQICSHVGVMHLGRLVAQAPLPELQSGSFVAGWPAGKRQTTPTGTLPRVRVESAEPAAAERVLTELGLSDVTSRGDETTATLGGRLPEKVLAELVAGGVPVRGYGVVAPDLEEIFVGLTGEGFDVSG